MVDMKVTFENLCQELNNDIYDGGVDRDSLVVTLEDVYKWIVLNPDRRISLPATSTDPDDRYRFMFPQGCRVNTRTSKGPSSVSSKNSSNVPKSVRQLSPRYTRSQSGTSSVSKGTSRYIGFAEDDDATTDTHTNVTTVPPRHRSRRGSVSISEVRSKNIIPEEDHEIFQPTDPRPPRRRNETVEHNPRFKQTTSNRPGPGFADE